MATHGKTTQTKNATPKPPTNTPRNIIRINYTHRFNNIRRKRDTKWKQIQNNQHHMTETNTNRNRTKTNMQQHIHAHKKQQTKQKQHKPNAIMEGATAPRHRTHCAISKGATYTRSTHTVLSPRVPLALSGFQREGSKQPRTTYNALPPRLLAAPGFLIDVCHRHPPWMHTVCQHGVTGTLHACTLCWRGGAMAPSVFKNIHYLYIVIPRSRARAAARPRDKTEAEPQNSSLKLLKIASKTSICLLCKQSLKTHF